MKKANDIYGGGVGTIDPGAQKMPSLNTKASPMAAGAGVGQAVEGFGREIDRTAETFDAYKKTFAEAKANDVIANKWTPKLVEMRAGFDTLGPEQKVDGYENYINSLKTHQQEIISSSKSPYEKEILSNYFNKQLVQEQESTGRELSKALNTFAGTAAWNRIKADSTYGANNYNDPTVVEKVLNSNRALATLNVLDQGIDPTTDEGMAAIDEAHRDADSTLAEAMINRAADAGDVASAYKIRSDYSSVISGEKAIALGDRLNLQATRQNSVNTVKNILGGKPVPVSVGAPAPHVQAVVADTAQIHGIDPNLALTVARIESNYGQNVGKRGDIGQTGKGGDIGQQAQNMVVELKKSQGVAAKVVGGEPEAWQTYLCYQQGIGGGPALLNSHPDAKAVNVLKGLYKNPKDALSAIVNNGGNANMTVGDFCALIKTKVDKNAARARIEIPTQQSNEGGTLLGQNVPSIGDAIMKPHQTETTPLQFGATPQQTLNNFNAKAPNYISQINSIPNLEQRAAAMKEFENQKNMFEAAAKSYKDNLSQEIITLGVNKNFTSLDQVPPHLMAGLADNPKLYEYLDKQATNHTSGKAISKNDPNVIWQMGELENMKFENPKAFMDYDFTDLAGKIPGDDILQYQKQAAEMRAGKTVSATEAEQNRIVTDAVALNLIDKGEEEAQFRNALNTRIQNFTEVNGKKPTWTDLQAMKDSLLTEVVMKGWFNTDKKVYEVTKEDYENVAVPLAEKEIIIKQLQDRGVTGPISDEQVQQIYINSLNL